MSARLEFVPLQPFHVKQVTLQKAQHLDKFTFTDRLIGELCGGRAAEALLADGLPVACGGLLDEQGGRAKAWTLIGDGMPQTAWNDVIARMRAGIEAALRDGFHRVWAETVYDWPEGHKLLLHLGMAYEGTTRGTFGPGRHGVIYARVGDDVAALPIRVRCMNLTAERCLWEDSMSQAVPWAVEEARRHQRAVAR